MYKVTVFYGAAGVGISDNLDIYTDQTLGFVESNLNNIVINRIKSKDGLTTEKITWAKITKVEKIDGILLTNNQPEEGNGRIL